MLRLATQSQNEELNIFISFLIVFVFHVLLILIIPFVLDYTNNLHSANAMPFSEVQKMANDNFIEVELKEFPIEVFDDDIIELIEKQESQEIIEEKQEETLDKNKDSDIDKSISATVGMEFKQTYIGLVMALLSKNKYYPSIERKRGREGSVVVSFSIHPNGEASDIKIKTPSRYANLDKAAIETVKRSLPFPAFKGKKSLDISLSIDYQLDEV